MSPNFTRMKAKTAKNKLKQFPPMMCPIKTVKTNKSNISFAISIRKAGLQLTISSIKMTVVKQKILFPHYLIDKRIIFYHSKAKV